MHKYVNLTPPKEIPIESKFYLKGEQHVENAIKELINAQYVYLHEGPAMKTDHENNIMRHVYEAMHILTELEDKMYREPYRDPIEEED